MVTVTSWIAFSCPGKPSVAGWTAQANWAVLHEQVHIKLYPYRKHGKRFNQEMLRLAGAGAFDDLW